MIATYHERLPSGRSGRGTPLLSVSADSASAASPDLPACYGGGMSADTIEELTLGDVIARAVSDTCTAYVTANPPLPEGGLASITAALQTGLSFAVAEQIALLWAVSLTPGVGPKTPTEVAEFIRGVESKKRELRAARQGASS